MNDTIKLEIKNINFEHGEITLELSDELINYMQSDPKGVLPYLYFFTMPPAQQTVAAPEVAPKVRKKRSSKKQREAPTVAVLDAEGALDLPPVVNPGTFDKPILLTDTDNDDSLECAYSGGVVPPNVTAKEVDIKTKAQEVAYEKHIGKTSTPTVNIDIPNGCEEWATEGALTHPSIQKLAAHYIRVEQPGSKDRVDTVKFIIKTAHGADYLKDVPPEELGALRDTLFANIRKEEEANGTA